MAPSVEMVLCHLAALAGLGRDDLVFYFADQCVFFSLTDELPGNSRSRNLAAV